MRTNSGYAVLGGGRRNQVDGDATSVLGGRYNSAQGLTAVMLGGESNRIAADAAFLGGGQNNTNARAEMKTGLTAPAVTQASALITGTSATPASTCP